MMGWVLFRADTFPHTVTYFTALLGGSAAVHPQPLFRYTSNEVLWNLGLGVAFSAPLWAGIKDVFITRCQTFPAGRRRFYSAMGRATEIALIVAGPRCLGNAVGGRDIQPIHLFPLLAMQKDDQTTPSSSWSDCVLTGIFILLIWLPLLAKPFHWDTAKELNENRFLAKRPHLSEFRSRAMCREFLASCQDYFNDHFLWLPQPAHFLGLKLGNTLFITKAVFIIW